jgi:ubiquinone/menaquinone biosynthesis C-methylase UbiE
MVKNFIPFIKKGSKVLDIGCGWCNVSKILRDKGFKVTPLDIRDISFYENIKAIIYNGKKFPFKNKSFDYSLILTVLHHTPDPEMIIKEAMRVSDKIIIIEDIYYNWIHKKWTHFFDSLFNLEFKGHPHSNKSDSEWRMVFKKLKLKVVKAKYCTAFFIFRQATYYLEK